MRRNEKLAAAGRLTAALAHEINNPLEAVTNLLYLARNDPSRADMHLRMAEREVLRVADIAQLTLGFVRDDSRGFRQFLKKFWSVMQGVSASKPFGWRRCSHPAIISMGFPPSSGNYSPI